MICHVIIVIIVLVSVILSCVGYSPDYKFSIEASKFADECTNI